MTALPLVIAPDPIFKKKAEPVAGVTDEVRKIMDNMMGTLHVENGVGMAATMVGILKRIVVINLDEKGEKKKLLMANPQVIDASEEKQTYLEASLCFPGISADVERPKAVKVKYLDYYGNEQEIEAEGFLATCLQHEIDYLDGVVFLDYLSSLKKNTLMRKMKKYIKQGRAHTCSSSCAH